MTPLLVPLLLLVVLAAAAEGAFTVAGGVCDTSATLRVHGWKGQQLVVRRESDSSIVLSETTLASDLTRVYLGNLSPLTTYIYSVANVEGRFTTHPVEGEKHSFTFGFGACMFVGRNRKLKHTSEALRRMIDLSPPLQSFIQMGDLHYDDIGANDVGAFHASTDVALSESRMQLLMSKVPLVYVWDDHDFGENNAGALSPSRPAARLAYQLNSPHHKLPSVNASGDASTCIDERSLSLRDFDDASAPPPVCGQRITDTPIYQAYTVGRVRFIVSDLRSEALEATMMGPEQLSWFRGELSQAGSYAMVVWVSSKPWIGASAAEGAGRDSWGGHADERATISDWMLEFNVTNLVALTGDAHMLAIDDGTHTDYSTQAARDAYPGSLGAGFPVMNSAPLANLGSSKGGPYSKGCYSYKYHPNSHFATMSITDDDDGVCFTWHGFAPDRAGMDPVLTHSACAPFAKQGVLGGGRDLECEIQWAPAYVWFLAISSILVFAIVPLVTCLALRKPEGMPKRMCSPALLGVLGLFLVFLLIDLGVILGLKEDIKFKIAEMLGGTLAQGLLLLAIVAGIKLWRQRITIRARVSDVQQGASRGSHPDLKMQRTRGLLAQSSHDDGEIETPETPESPQTPGSPSAAVLHVLDRDVKPLQWPADAQEGVNGTSNHDNEEGGIVLPSTQQSQSGNADRNNQPQGSLFISNSGGGHNRSRGGSNTHSHSRVTAGSLDSNAGRSPLGSYTHSRVRESMDSATGGGSARNSGSARNNTTYNEAPPVRFTASPNYNAGTSQGPIAKNTTLDTEQVSK